MPDTSLRAVSPAILRELGAPPEWSAEHSPSFVNWAVEEVDRLRGQITSDTTREQRFEIQNRIAGISGTAYAYGQWLYQTAGA